MRLAAYAGASTVLAAGVILRAFHERPNFYSAAVYLGQSNACRLILLNMLLLSAGASMYVLQRLFYGPLRAIEIEQLWDKAWYAITETALAMTTFRDEVGGWFFIMFISLLAGKVWGWIGEGRVEIMEQQPPANPRLFHTRLMASLVLSELFDLLMLRYCLQTLSAQPRPGMMVMFAFEFGVLAIVSSSTIVRYILHLQEKLIIRRQTQAKVEERREEIRLARQDAESQVTNESNANTRTNVPNEDDIDESEIDVPGWQEKGRYILFLDLTTDFLKLVLYIGFFLILLFFSGIPVHMFRDLFITSRSFIKRINDYFKYRNATRDMNARYPDATAEDLERESTCIICREEMRVWQTPVQQQAAGTQQRSRSPPDERQRPKKLPCGHILHFGCLRSWLERQQVCPTCRRSVLVENNHSSTNQQATANGVQHGQRPANEQGNQNRNDAAQHGQRRNGLRARTWNLGSLRLTFATGNAQQFQNALQQLREQQGQVQNGANNNAANAVNTAHGQQGHGNATSIQEQLGNMERQIMQDIDNLHLTQHQLAHVAGLQQELSRLRELQSSGSQQANSSRNTMENPAPLQMGPNMSMPDGTRLLANARPINSSVVIQQGHHALHNHIPQQFLSTHNQETPLGADHASLPQGLTIPNGWSVLPLHSNRTWTSADQLSSHAGQEIVAPLPQIPVETSLHTPPVGQPDQATSDVSRENTSSSLHSSSQVVPASSQPTRTHNAQTDAPIPSSVQEDISSLPNWSSDAVEASDDILDRRSSGAQGEQRHGSENDITQANGSAHASKGKARAVSVEDAEEDEK